jgi:hypothetical protein
MILRKNRLTVYLCLLILGCVLYGMPSVTHAASLYFSPSSITRSEGQTFSATLRVNTEGQAINAAQGSVVFDTSKLEVISLSKTGSIFNLWTQDPTFSNAEGSADFEGGLPSPGYSGSSGLILTITFRVKPGTQGSTEASLVSGAILANDGEGTNILTALGKIDVGVNNSALVSVTPTLTLTPTPQNNGAPSLLQASIYSSSNPDPTQWYSTNKPTFNWDLPSGVTGVSYLITDRPNSNPGPKSDGLRSSVTFDSIPDGTQYFHIKFQKNGTWGTITHFQFNIDTTPPAPFSIRLAGEDKIHPEIVFVTQDVLSGLNHYEIKVGDQNWIRLSADQGDTPYRLSFNRIGTQTVYVKAIDNAGNEIIESIPVTVSSKAVGISTLSWLAKLFNSIVNISSGYSIAIALLIALVGLLVLLFHFLGNSIDRAWHRFENRKSLKKTERKADTTFDRILDDMKDEIKFLNSIAKRRRLGSEEKYLKSKLEQYLKSLRNER